MNWYSLTLNPEAILTLYPSSPALDKLHIHKVHLEREGPSLVLDAELPLYPECPPSRWHKAYSAAQVKLEFLGVRELSIVGWSTINNLTLHVRKDEKALSIVLSGENVSIMFVTDFIRIVGIVGYAKSA